MGDFNLSQIESDLSDPLRGSDDLFSKRMSRRELIAMKAARREAMNTERLLRQHLGDDLLNTELQGGSVDFVNPVTGSIDPFGAVSNAFSRVADKAQGVTQPLFDLLQIGQFGTAGAALELQRGGNTYEALRRAGAEMVNALPMLDEEDAKSIFGINPTRPSWSEFIQNTELDPFENERHNEWFTAASGLVLDILLDPTTYFGGAILRAPVAAGGKILPYLGDTIPAFGKMRESVGRNLIPNFELNEFARRNPEVAESVENFITGLNTRKGEIAEGALEINDVAISLRAGLSAPESRILGLYMDQPEHFNSIIETIGAGNNVFVGHMKEKYKAFGEAYKRQEQLSLKAGLLDESQLVSDFATGRMPVTGSSARAHQQLMNKLGLPAHKTDHELSDLAATFIKDNGLGDETLYAKSRKIKTLEDRVLATVGTELDASVNFALRGYDEVRRRSTKRFMDSVANDSKVVLKIPDPALLTAIRRGGDGNTLGMLTEAFGEKQGRQLFEQSENFRQLLSQNGMRIWRSSRRGVKDLTSVSKLSRGKRYVDSDGSLMEVVGVVAKGKKKGQVRVKNFRTGKQSIIGRDKEITPITMAPAYAMPKEFVDALDVADNVMRTPDAAGKFFRLLQKIQSPWKGWALFSPSYHLRNGWSNGWNNLLAGVQSPVPYARALAMMFRDSRAGVNVAGMGGEELYSLARRHRVIDSGMFKQDLGINTEEEIFQKLYREGPESLVDLTSTLATAKGKELDDVLETLHGRNITRRDVLRGVVDISPEENALEFAKRQFGPNNTLLKANHLLGRKNEEVARLAHFLDRLNKGDTAEQASFSVRKFLFDYEELTPFERDVMKSVLPFYTWMRKNIPLQLESIVKAPGRYAAITGKPIQAIESLSPEYEDIPTPDYFSEIHAVRMPREMTSLINTVNQSFDDAAASLGADPTAGGPQPIYINPNFPFQDLNRLNYRDLLAGTNPFIKMPLERVLGGSRGYNIFLDRPIERFEGEPAPFDLLGTGVRPRGKDMSFIEGLFPPVGKLQRLYESKLRGQSASSILPELPIPGVGGLKPIQVDIDRVKKGKLFRRRDQLRSIRLKYRAMGLNI
tara:strand:- start:1133 stop:4399 length:3267 start_codon:yes stop_codon:yes gene_type:complete